MGVIFFREGKPFVLEAAATVKYTPFAEWTARGVEGRYQLRRLKNADRRLDANTVSALRQAGERYLGRPYDLYFEWSDDRIYCSELAWKMYDSALHVEIGRLQDVRTFRLDDPVVQAKMRERFGPEGPRQGSVISPVAMFESEELLPVGPRAACDADAAREVATGIVAADNAGDIERVLAYYAADAVLVPPGEAEVAGRDAIRPRYEKLFFTFRPRIELRIDETVVEGDSALVRGHNGGTLEPKDGSPSKALDDDFRMKLRCEGKLWRIAHLAWQPASKP